MVTKYGIISDTHERPKIVPLAIAILKKEGAEKLIFNGDLGNEESEVVATLYHIARSELETYVQPGSHEQVRPFEEAMDYFKTKANIIHAVENPRIEAKDHELVFLPGSDWGPTGEYIWTINELDSGFYRTSNGPRRITNLNDLKKNIVAPDKTIFVSHVPMLFEGQDAVDKAYFVEMKGGSVMAGVAFEEMVQRKVGRELTNEEIRMIALQNGHVLKRENRGNKDLAAMLKEVEISKAISGHFHESVHNVHDSKGNPVVEGEMTDSLFWNASYLDGGKFGLLTVDGNRASYRNLDLMSYLE